MPKERGRLCVVVSRNVETLEMLRWERGCDCLSLPAWQPSESIELAVERMICHVSSANFDQDAHVIHTQEIEGAHSRLSDSMAPGHSAAAAVASSRPSHLPLDQSLAAIAKVRANRSAHPAPPLDQLVLLQP